VTKLLIFVSHDSVHFNVFGYDTWVDLKYFEIQPEESDVELLEALIAHEQYQDHYAVRTPLSRPSTRCMAPIGWRRSRQRVSRASRRTQLVTS
jgi:hypothetical protein